MNGYEQRLREKWGEFIKVGNYLSNGKMSFISDDARLNVFFDPLPLESVEAYFNDVLKAKAHPELMEFYKWTNGCRLFFASLSMYGISRDGKDVLVPFDLDYENRKLLKSMPDNDYVFFASIGGAYVFAYDRSMPSKVFGMKVGSTEILQTFEGVYEFFDHYFNALIEEYDVHCKKIHPTDAYLGIPVLENKCIDLL